MNSEKDITFIKEEIEAECLHGNFENIDFNNDVKTKRTESKLNENLLKKS